ncbi:MAG: L,D-transpeptidase [Alphaproteobacteria bacterium]
MISLFHTTALSAIMIVDGRTFFVQICGVCRCFFRSHSEQAKLGQPASAGCVRVSTEDSKWIYDTLPLGVEVTVED